MHHCKAAYNHNTRTHAARWARGWSLRMRSASNTHTHERHLQPRAPARPLLYFVLPLGCALSRLRRTRLRRRAPRTLRWPRCRRRCRCRDGHSAAACSNPPGGGALRLMNARPDPQEGRRCRRCRRCRRALRCRCAAHEGCGGRRAARSGHGAATSQRCCRRRGCCPGRRAPRSSARC